MPDRRDLLKWFDAVAPSKPRTIITHGEDRAREVFSGFDPIKTWNKD